jgi:thiol-disulfide isomerase/thioredoxin
MENSLMALLHTPTDSLGSALHNFNLPGVDGQNFASESLAHNHPALIMFICNHCPYVKAIEDRLIVLANDLKKIDVSVVAISSNDANHYPEDSFAQMKLRSKQKHYSFAYLYDEDQSVAKKFGAVCTPDFFLYDKNQKLAYRGRLDDSWKDASLVKERSLYQAAMKLSLGEKFSETSIPSMGCSIKWISNKTDQGSK